MKATERKVRTITLELNEQEVEWLKGVMQNPIGASLAEEPKFDREMRHLFWTALNPDETDVPVIVKMHEE